MACLAQLSVPAPQGALPSVLQAARQDADQAALVVRRLERRELQGAILAGPPVAEQAGLPSARQVGRNRRSADQEQAARKGDRQPLDDLRLEPFAAEHRQVFEPQGQQKHLTQVLPRAGRLLDVLLRQPKRPQEERQPAVAAGAALAAAVELLQGARPQAALGVSQLVFPRREQPALPLPNSAPVRARRGALQEQEAA